jgi:hypothetical protein
MNKYRRLIKGEKKLVGETGTLKEKGDSPAEIAIIHKII